MTIIQPNVFIVIKYFPSPKIVYRELKKMQFKATLVFLLYANEYRCLPSGGAIKLIGIKSELMSIFYSTHQE